MAGNAPAKRRAEQWESVYTSRRIEDVSWFQAEPAVSLELIEELGVPRDAAVVDVGGGASLLADRLVERGFADVTVLDLSVSALEQTRRRLGEQASVQLLREDVIDWRPERDYDLWHDRAAFHFLSEADDRRRYLRTLLAATRAGSGVVLATFAPDGPDRCSGLPVVRYSAEALMAALGDRAELVTARREDHVTPRRVVQPFTWIAARICAS